MSHPVVRTTTPIAQIRSGWIDGRTRITWVSVVGRPVAGDFDVGVPEPALYSGAMDVFEMLVALDQALLDVVLALRTDALTPVMRLASQWWVKTLAIPALGIGAELARRRRSLPPTLPAAAVALVAASLASAALKQLFDRARPSVADPSVTVLVGLPGDPSLPSGHATTAFAAAGVVAALHPALRLPALALAALVALSRVYLGVHYPADVVAGALLGLAIAAAVIAVGRRVAPRTLGPGPGSRPRRTRRMRRWRSTHST